MLKQKFFQLPRFIFLGKVHRLLQEKLIKVILYFYSAISFSSKALYNDYDWKSKSKFYNCRRSIRDLGSLYNNELALPNLNVMTNFSVCASRINILLSC